MRYLPRLIAWAMFALLGVPAFAQGTSPLPGQVQITDTLQISSQGRNYVQLQLVNCPTQHPRVILNAVLSRTVVQTNLPPFNPDASGNVSGYVYPNDILSCDGTVGHSAYRVTYVQNGVPTGQTEDFIVTSGVNPFNLSSNTPVTQLPPPFVTGQDFHFRNLTLDGTLNANEVIANHFVLNPGALGQLNLWSTGTGAGLNIAPTIQISTAAPDPTFCNAVTEYGNMWEQTAATSKFLSYCTPTGWQQDVASGGGGGTGTGGGVTSINGQQGDFLFPGFACTVGPNPVCTYTIVNVNPAVAGQVGIYEDATHVGGDGFLFDSALSNPSTGGLNYLGPGGAVFQNQRGGSFAFSTSNSSGSAFTSNQSQINLKTQLDASTGSSSIAPGQISITAKDNAGNTGAADIVISAIQPSTANQVSNAANVLIHAGAGAPASSTTNSGNVTIETFSNGSSNGNINVTTFGGGANGAAINLTTQAAAPGASNAGQINLNASGGQAAFTVLSSNFSLGADGKLTLPNFSLTASGAATANSDVRSKGHLVSDLLNPGCVQADAFGTIINCPPSSQGTPTGNFGDLASYSFDGSVQIPTRVIGAVTLDTATPYTSPSAASFKGAGYFYESNTWTAAPTTYSRFYLKINAATTAAIDLYSASNTTTELYKLSLAAGTDYLTLYNDATATSTTCLSAPIPLSTWHYVEMYRLAGTGTAGAYTVKLDGATTLCTSAAANTGALGVTSVEFGQLSTPANPWDVEMDNVDVSSTGYLGAVTFTTGTTGGTTGAGTGGATPTVQQDLSLTASNTKLCFVGGTADNTYGCKGGGGIGSTPPAIIPPVEMFGNCVAQQAGTVAAVNGSQGCTTASPSLGGADANATAFFSMSATGGTSADTEVLYPHSASNACPSCSYYQRDVYFRLADTQQGTTAPNTALYLSNLEMDTDHNIAASNTLYSMGWQCNRFNTGFWQYDNQDIGWRNTLIPCSLQSGHIYHTTLNMHRVPGQTSCTYTLPGGAATTVAVPCSYWDKFTLADVTAGTTNTYDLQNPGGSQPAAILPTNAVGWSNALITQWQLDTKTHLPAQETVGVQVDNDVITASTSPITSQAGSGTTATANPGNLASYSFDSSAQIPTTSAGTVTFDTTNAYTAPSAAEFNAASEYYTTAAWSVSPTIYSRFYFKINTATAASTKIVSLYNGNSELWNLYFTATSNNLTAFTIPTSTNTACLSSTLSAAVWHYIEFFWQQGAGTAGAFTVKLDGAATNCAVTGANTGTVGATNLRFGELSATGSPWDVEFDNVDVGNTGYLGAITFNSNTGGGNTSAYDPVGSADQALVAAKNYTNQVAVTQVTGDASGSGAGTQTVTVTGLNGVQLGSLSTCLLKNTTGTGVPTCAVSGTDYAPPGGGGGGSGPTIQTNGTPNTSQTLLNFVPSSANAVGLTITPSNSGANEKFEIAGSPSTLNGAAPPASALVLGTNSSQQLIAATSAQIVSALNTTPSTTLAPALLPLTLPYDPSGSATTAQNNAEGAFSGDVTKSALSFVTTVTKVNGGTVPASAALVGTNSTMQFVALTSLPNGMTATTQTTGENTAKVATDAFVQANLALYAPLASPTFTGSPSLPTGATAVTQTTADNSTKLATTAYSQSLIAGLGVAGRSVSGTTDTILSTDRGQTILYTSASSVAVALPSAASFGGHFIFVVQGQTGSGTITFTSAGGTFLNSSGGSATTQSMTAGQRCSISSPDNANWLAGCTSIGSGLSGFPITLGATSIASSSTTTAVTGLTVDGVSPTTMGFVDLSSSAQTQLNAKAPLASPTFTGTPAVPTAAPGTNTTQAASTAFVTAAISGISGGGASTPATTNLLKGNGSVNGVQAATPGTDYAVPSGNISGTAANLSGTPALPSGTTATTQTTGDTTTKLATDAFASNAANLSSGTVPIARLTLPLSCQPGIGDGLNAIPAGTYLQTTCRNDTGQTWTLTAIKCVADAGSSTCNVTNGAATALLTGAITGTSTYASGTQSATTTIASGDFLKVTFVADGTSKQIGLDVAGTY